MKLEEMKLEEIVEYINKELTKGRTLKEIETIDFKVNDRVIAKRLSRKGYKRIDNQYLYKSITNKLTKTPSRIKEDITSILPMYNQLDLNKLNELINLVDSIAIVRCVKLFSLRHVNILDTISSEPGRLFLASNDKSFLPKKSKAKT